ncbi:hypothetical protein PoB_000569300 [Plakobranchus ocellatus]|uniref:Uncharacterized protein n=1 Tax=Plakobranchus ocellatus TaxID=259542 RepID=A0AAV3Y9L1_9GAST|nr:hypothetical protein PoB_000569300 [Plakobranchus ocellatus]
MRVRADRAVRQYEEAIKLISRVTTITTTVTDGPVFRRADVSVIVILQGDGEEKDILIKGKNSNLFSALFVPALRCHCEVKRSRAANTMTCLACRVPWGAGLTVLQSLLLPARTPAASDRRPGSGDRENSLDQFVESRRGQVDIELLCR